LYRFCAHLEGTILPGAFFQDFAGGCPFPPQTGPAVKTKAKKNIMAGFYGLSVVDFFLLAYNEMR
jgi:hypothetical protein